MKYIKENWHNIALLFMLNFLLVMMVELLWRKSFTNLSSWMVHQFPLVILNVAILLILSIIITIITRRYAISFVIVSNIVMVLALINAKKIALRNVPLLVDDVHLFNEAMKLLPQFADLKSIMLLSVILLLVVGLSYLFIKHSHRFMTTHKHHMIFAVILSVSAVLLGQMSYGSTTDITSSGLIVSLFNDVKSPTSRLSFDDSDLEEIDLEIKKSLNEKETPSELTGEVTNPDEPTELLLKSDVKPNVIVIQSEAFWDINKLGLELNINPLKNFYSLKNESIHGEMYVPVIGGGTVNTEYEVMTGMSLKNYDSDSYMVYPNDIKSPTSSLASIFKADGYYSVATHPFYGWYYNRVEVFNHFGFDEFKTLEFMDDAEFLGSYVTDEYITDEIIKTLADHEEPVFNLVLTMQNHAPFNDWRFKQDELIVTFRDIVDKSSIDTINNYANSLYKTDLELKRLTDYLKNSDEPTVVLFYGDHLPFMGDDYLVYKDTDYLAKDEIFVNDNMDMMTTPFILWSNYNTTEKDLGILNASYLPAIMLEQMDQERPQHMKVLASMFEESPLFTRSFLVDSDGQKKLSDSDEYVNLMKKLYYLLQQKDDLTIEENLKWIVTENEHYNEGYDMDKVKNPNK